MIGRAHTIRCTAPWLAGLVVFAGAAALAGEGTEVRLLSPDAGEKWAGERIDFSIELIAQGQFSGASRFELPRLKNAILLQVSTRPVIGSRAIGGETYVVQAHSFALFAQRGGRLTVPAIGVRFGSKSRFGQPLVEHDLPTDEFTLDIRAPSGAEPGRPIVAASNLLADEDWQPAPAAASVGDALTRNIRLTADGVPSMLLPAIRFTAPEGVAVYPADPELHDKMNRGEFRGERVERATYVFESAGEFELPAIRVRWWDPDLSEWRSKEFPAVTVEVAALSASQEVADGDVGGARADQRWLKWIALAGIGVVLLVLAMRMLLPAWSARRAAREAGEPAHFRRLLETCKAGNPVQIYQAVSCWLDRLGLTTVQLGPDDGPARTLRRDLGVLQQRIVGRESANPSSELRTALVAFRHARLATRRQQGAAPLPELNPRG